MTYPNSITQLEHIPAKSFKTGHYHPVSRGADVVTLTGTSRTSSKGAFARRALSLVPILEWLPNYKWKEHLLGDIIAGLTVGIMHVPQGMAYASLAGVPPIYGMYSSFFASIIYMFLGTGRHISIGVFAVASMMVGACRFRLAPDPSDITNSTADWPLGKEVTPLELTSALTLVVGVVQVCLGALRLGFLTTYLSDPLVSGFTTGSAAHVLVSQLNKVFGVKLPRHSGIGMLVRMVRDLIFSLSSTNLVALSISVAGIIFLDTGRTYLNPLVKKFSPVPPPLELILVIIGVIMSVTFGLNENYDVKVVNTIAKGLPVPSLPDVSLFPHLIADAIPIAVVCYMFVVSMGKLFAKKHKYKTDATQELYAVGLMSIGSSFFPVYPMGASLSRSSVCEMSGANTQLYTVFSSSLLLTVILFLGPYLEPLPMCILACIVIVSLKSLFLQVNQLPRLWQVSRYDFAIWMVACLSTILTDVTKGLVISIAFAVLTIVLREQWPRFTEVPLCDIPPQNVGEGVRIVKFDAPLHFANVTKFVDQLTAMIGESKDEALFDSRAIIVDCSAIAYIDTMGVDAFKDMYLEAKKCDISIVFSGLNGDIMSDYEYESYDDDDIDMDKHSDGQMSDMDDSPIENYKIFSLDEISSEMAAMSSDLSDVMDIPSTACRLLLRKFKWEKEKLLEKFYECADSSKFISDTVQMDVVASVSKEAESIGDCDICCDEAPLSGLSCGHSACADCWDAYLTNKIRDDGIFNILCIGGSCEMHLNDEQVCSYLTDDAMKLAYKRLLVNDFVDANRLLKWCPGQDCGSVVKIHDRLPRSVYCVCGSSFCSACPEDPHLPLPCKFIKIWLAKEKSDGQYLIPNVRPCPSCEVPIEKNGGCNYMHCTQPSCKCYFCWACMRTFARDHEGHNCHIYVENEDAAAALRDQLRFNHYFDRYNIHQESLGMEKSLTKSAARIKQDHQEQYSSSFPAEIALMEGSLSTLAMARRVVMFTYPFAFFIKNDMNKAILEDNQKDLETATEHLSQLIEDNVNAHYFSTFLETWREASMKIRDKMSYVESRRKVLLQHCEECVEKGFFD